MHPNLFPFSFLPEWYKSVIICTNWKRIVLKYSNKLYYFCKNHMGYSLFHCSPNLDRGCLTTTIDRFSSLFQISLSSSTFFGAFSILLFNSLLFPSVSIKWKIKSVLESMPFYHLEFLQNVQSKWNLLLWESSTLRLLKSVIRFYYLPTWYLHPCWRAND